MLVKIADLRPNPFRDFKIDPIDEERVAELVEQLRRHPEVIETIVCRRIGDAIEICAGHHRVEAARRLGVKSADVRCASDESDLECLHTYASENAVRRNESSAVAGAIAGAVKFLARAILTDDEATTQKFLSGPRAFANARDHFQKSGIGEALIVRLFANAGADYSQGSVREQLAGMKSSGTYARLIREVEKQIEAEEHAAEQELLRLEDEARRAKQRADADRKRKEAEEQRRKQQQLNAAKKKAKKAADDADEKDVTFDYEGVLRHLTVESHVAAFRKVVTSPNVAKYLPVANQAGLAKQLVDKARKEEKELSVRWIRETIPDLLLTIRRKDRELDKKEKDDIRNKNWESKARGYQTDFIRHWGAAHEALLELRDHTQECPDGVTFMALAEFVDTLRELIREVPRFADLVNALSGKPVPRRRNKLPALEKADD